MEHYLKIVIISFWLSKNRKALEHLQGYKTCGVPNLAFFLVVNDSCKNIYFLIIIPWILSKQRSFLVEKKDSFFREKCLIILYYIKAK